MSQDQTQAPAPKPAVDWSMTLLALVMVAVMVALVWLWLNERRARVAAQDATAQLQERVKAVQTAQIGMMLQNQGLQRAPVGIDEVVPVTFSLSGTRVAMRVTDEGAKRLGFGDGQVVLVLPAGALPPASAPASRPGAGE